MYVYGHGDWEWAETGSGSPRVGNEPHLAVTIPVWDRDDELGYDPTDLDWEATTENELQKAFAELLAERYAAAVQQHELQT